MNKVLTIITVLVAGVALYKAYDENSKKKAEEAAGNVPAKALTWEEAQTKVTDAGYILFAYADGWDTYSKQVSNKLMKNKAVKKAAGDAIVLHYPIKQALNEEEQKARTEQWKGIKVPNADSYPALLFFDNKGKHYSTISGTFMRKAQPKKVAKMITERMEGKRKQNELMAQAEKAKGAEKARLIAEACLIENINRPDRYEKMMKDADPKDECGLIRRVTFNPWVFVESKRKEDPKAVLAELETMLADPNYTDEQKQIFCTCAIGTLHRSNLPDAATRIQEYAKKLKEYGKDTVLGQSADIVVREWVVTLNYGEGWQPAALPEDETPTELEGNLPIDQPGTYTVAFNYKRGSHALRVKAVELYDGDTKVAEDRHDGFMGVKVSKNTYDLKVDKEVKNPRILITFNMGKNRDSYGRISIVRQK
ncbi:MAG: hypothetical protein IKV82_03305 [Akkermansia sp.]|nr:hypothetical protein [Akkermansia sp.]